MNNTMKYDEYVRAYNKLGDKLDELGANDEIFKMLQEVCQIALNIDLDLLCKEIKM